MYFINAKYSIKNISLTQAHCAVGGLQQLRVFSKKNAGIFFLDVRDTFVLANRVRTLLYMIHTVHTGNG